MDKEELLKENYVIAYPPIISGTMDLGLILFSSLMVYGYIINQLRLFEFIVLGTLLVVSIYGVLGSHVSITPPDS